MMEETGVLLRVLLEETTSNHTTNHTSEHSASHEHHSTAHYVVFSVFFALGCGCLIKYGFSKISIPYTVLLLVFGLVCGELATVSGDFESYSAIEDIDPHLLLHSLLPVLLFESAFTLDFHIFKRSLGSILLLAIPGVLIATALTGLVKYMFPYDWTWSQSLLLGSILSATDPVAVVALLRDLGASPVLSTIIEGESLLNDGSAIVVFTVIKELVMTDLDPEDTVDFEFFPTLGIFFYIGCVGPIVGYVFGVLTVYWLKFVYNDFLVEITSTLCATYMCFYVAEEFLGVSGVLAVVVFGLYMNVYGKTTVMHEIQHFMHIFYTMMGYLANTIIFILCGLIISRKSSFDAIDTFWLLLLYVWLHVVRGLVTCVFFPLLNHMGYGLNWRQAVIMVWGGLRGAVGLALALVITLEASDYPEYTSQILFFVSGIVVLTLIINGMTIKSVLKLLGMTEIPRSKLNMLRNSILFMNAQIEKKLTHLQHDNFFSDANWNHVLSWCYQPTPPIVPEFDNNDKEYRESVRYETFKRILNAQKASYWHQFEEGLLGQKEVLLLLETTDEALDKHEGLVAFHDIKTLTDIPDLLKDAHDYVKDWPLVGAFARRQIFEHLFFAYRVSVGYMRALRVVDHMAKKDKIDRTNQDDHKTHVQPVLVDGDQQGPKSEHQPLRSVQQETQKEHQTKSYCIIIDDELLEEIKTESRLNQNRTLQYLYQLREAYPEISSAIKSFIAGHTMLNFETRVIKTLIHKGSLEETEGEKLILGVQACQKRLRVLPPPITSPDYVDVISDLPWLSGVTIDREVVRNAISEVILDRDEVLFLRGEPSDGIYLIISGVARIETDGRLIAMAGPGKVFGEMAVLTRAKRSADIKAETYLVCLRITPVALQSFFQSDPKVEQQLWRNAALKFAADELRQTSPFEEWDERHLQLWCHEGDLFSFSSMSEEKYITRLIADYLTIVICGDVEIIPEPGVRPNPLNVDAVNMFYGPVTLRLSQGTRLISFRDPPTEEDLMDHGHAEDEHGIHRAHKYATSTVDAVTKIGERATARGTTHRVLDRRATGTDIPGDLARLAAASRQMRRESEGDKEDDDNDPFTSPVRKRRNSAPPEQFPGTESHLFNRNQSNYHEVETAPDGEENDIGIGANGPGDIELDRLHSTPISFGEGANSPAFVRAHTVGWKDAGSHKLHPRGSKEAKEAMMRDLRLAAELQRAKAAEKRRIEAAYEAEMLGGDDGDDDKKNDNDNDNAPKKEQEKEQEKEQKKAPDDHRITIHNSPRTAPMIGRELSLPVNMGRDKSLPVKMGQQNSSSSHTRSHSVHTSPAQFSRTQSVPPVHGFKRENSFTLKQLHAKQCPDLLSLQTDGSFLRPESEEDHDGSDSDSNFADEFEGYEASISEQMRVNGGSRSPHASPSHHAKSLSHSHFPPSQPSHNRRALSQIPEEGHIRSIPSYEQLHSPNGNGNRMNRTTTTDDKKSGSAASSDIPEIPSFRKLHSVPVGAGAGNGNGNGTSGDEAASPDKPLLAVAPGPSSPSSSTEPQYERAQSMHK